MKKLLYLLAFMAIPSMAQQITEKQAIENARHFLSTSSGISTRATSNSQLQVVEKGANDTWYVVNNGSSGYVIMSGDARTPSVLGYSDKNSFKDIPANHPIRTLLKKYTTQIIQLRNSLAPINSSYASSTKSRKNIAPLCSAEWGQDDPYNMKLPALRDMSKDSVYTGCIATALCQVLRYHKWPKTIGEVPGFMNRYVNKYGRKDSVYFEKLPSTTINWDCMWSNYYIANHEYKMTPDKADEAVAKLMRYTGQAMQLNYFVCGTGGLDIQQLYALTHFLDYKSSARIVTPEQYSPKDWEELLYLELEASRPILYEGFRIGGLDNISGHAFVVDGYEEQNQTPYFHVNWGWDGFFNGYYIIHDLGDEWIGSGFNVGASCVIGIEPNFNHQPIVDPEPFIASNDNEYPDTILVRKNANQDFEIPLSYYGMASKTNHSLYDCSFRIYDKNSKSVQPDETCISSYRSGDCFFEDSIPIKLKVKSFVPDGDYRIKLISRLHGNTKWNENMFDTTNKIEFTIKNNKLTFLELPKKLTNGEIILDSLTELNCHLRIKLTNETQSYSNNVYVWVNGEMYGGYTFICDPGKTASREFPILHYSDVDLTYNIVVTSDKAGRNVLAKKSILIPAGIEQVAAESTTHQDPSFNLAGQKISDSYKGIVIRKGKKVIVR